MEKFNLLKYSVAFAFTSFAVAQANAQQPNMLSFDKNYYKDYVGERVMVNSPSSISRNLDYNIANDGSGTAGEWGAPLTTNITADVVKVNPYDGCAGTITGVTGKIALIQRGNCEFGVKASNAQAGGAVAAIIVNNIDGGPVGMGAGASGAGVTQLPVLMISKKDGADIAAAIDGGQTVNMTLAKWSNGKTHDLGIVRTGMSMWHNYAIPANQMEHASTTDAYQGIDGVVIANFGTATETNVKLKTKVTFTPDGSSNAETIIDHESDPISTFTVADSIKSLFIDELYGLKDSKQTGRYDVSYEVVSDATDEFPSDNKATYSFYTTWNVFSKGRYDFQKNEPVVGISFGYSSGVDVYMRGPMYYVAKGGYQLKSVQASVSTGDANNTSLSGLGDLTIYVWKWVDGSNGSTPDSIMQSNETELVGEAIHTFNGAQDTSGHIYTLNINKYGKLSEPMVTDDSSWYWVTAYVPGSLYLGCDGNLNYYVRAFDRYYAADNYKEYYSINFPQSQDDWENTNYIPLLYPTGGSNIDSVEFAKEKQGIVPALPMIMSMFPVSVEQVNVPAVKSLIAYPNPASNFITFSPTFNQKFEKLGYKVISADGRIVMVNTMPYNADNKYTLDISNLAAGNYYIQMNVSDKLSSGRFTIAK